MLFMPKPESRSPAPTFLGAELDESLPETLEVGHGMAVFLKGSGERLPPGPGAVELVAGWARRPARRAGTSFWGVAPLAPTGAADEVEIELVARGGARAPLGRVVVEGVPAEHRRAASGAGTIAVCMATYDPDLELFSTQLESLRAQTDTDWTCVISDDCSPPERFAAMEAAVEGDQRLTVSRSSRRLGFYRNFERALRLAPPDAPLIALCDQDDSWHPDKLETLREALGDAQLVYSDHRLVSRDGRLLRNTLWHGRRPNHSSLVSLLVANSVTGAATLFKREIVDLAVPFPDPPGWQFHDHWIALVALAHGDLAYVDRPLYDYVQHAGAVFGDVNAGDGRPAEDGRRALLARARGGWSRWRAAYFHGYLPCVVQAETLLLRCPRMDERKRRALRRFISSERSPLWAAWLAARPLRALTGRNETLGSELQLALGIAWCWVAAASGALARRLGRARAVSAPGLASFEQRRLRRWRAQL